MGFLFGIQGRLNRGKWWLAGLIYLLIVAVTASIWIGIAFNLPNPGTYLALGILGAVIYIVMIVSGVSVGVKRLHDRDKSGWWLLVFYLVPAVLSAMARGLDMQRGPGAGLTLHLVALAIDIWALVELGCLRGTPGSNRFGPDPLASSAFAV